MTTKNNKRKKEVSMDDLARMMAGGFDTLSKKIDMTDTKVDGLRREVKAQFAEVGVRLNRMELQLIGAHDRRLDRLESDFQQIKTILEHKLEITFRK